ncbi:MAG: hypothetical protein D6754_07920 [Alphaproteobacteria bacterium]|nr:MAG: hypothetical protein D6754_07920 [Alphaproteobacteria bacterium]
MSNPTATAPGAAVIGAPARARRHPFLIAGAILAASGALALGMPGGLPVLAEDQPAPAPLVLAPDPGKAVSEATASLAARFGEGAEAVALQLTAEGEPRPLALGEAVRLPDGTTHLVRWASQGALPILRRDIRPEEEAALIDALDRHLPAGSTILAFPDVSRRLAAVIPARFPLAEAAEPLAIPADWAGRAEAIAAQQAELLGQPVSSRAPAGALTAFLEALLAEDVHGAARLRVLAGAGEAFVLIHLEDAFQIGQIGAHRPEMVRMPVGGETFSHDLARGVRRTAEAGGHAAWALDRGPDGAVRAHFLHDRAETATLLAQLLPFNTSRLGEVPGTRLVWQSGGYWLYRIEQVAKAG